MTKLCEIKKRSILFSLLFVLLPIFVSADTGTDELTVSQSVAISATILKGCSIGGGSSDVTSLGPLNFGTVSGLNNDVKIISSQNAGSIVIKCTPGISVSIGLDQGLNASSSIATGRLLRQSTGSNTLTYQLYQDSGFSQIWGNGTNGGAIMSFTATGLVEEFKIYARLFAVVALPPADQYNDTIIVTITY